MDACRAADRMSAAWGPSSASDADAAAIMGMEWHGTEEAGMDREGRRDERVG